MTLSASYVLVSESKPTPSHAVSEELQLNTLPANVRSYQGHDLSLISHISQDGHTSPLNLITILPLILEKAFTFLLTLLYCLYYSASRVCQSLHFDPPPVL